MKPHAIGPTITGQDAVITTIGPREGRAPTTVQTDTTTSIVIAMHHHGTRRLIAISNSGMFTQGDGPLTRLLVKPILRKLLRHPWADMRHMEDLIHATQLDWTILRPPMLTNGPHAASYRTSPNHNLRGAIRLSRANLADYILHCLTDPTTTHKAIAIST